MAAMLHVDWRGPGVARGHDSAVDKTIAPTTPPHRKVLQTGSRRKGLTKERVQVHWASATSRSRPQDTSQITKSTKKHRCRTNNAHQADLGSSTCAGSVTSTITGVG